MTTSLDRVTFLLGSGISIPSGYPSTASITASLFSKDWITAREQELGRIQSPAFDGLWQEHRKTTLLLRLLRNHVDQHLALYGDSDATYEDIYYLGQQLLDSLVGEYDNPGLLPWIVELRAKIDLLDTAPAPFFASDPVADLKNSHKLTEAIKRCLGHVQEAVAAQLVERKRKRGLRLFSEILAANKRSPLRIATLNHDTLLEAFFKKKPVSDGFVPFSKGAQIFSPRSFDDDKCYRVRLLKLHGSINWFSYRRKDEGFALKLISGDCNHVQDGEGKDLYLPTQRLLLAGTTNKELAYGSGIFLELMFQFHRLLKDTQILIVSGYGFGDKGINNRIWTWLDSSAKNRLLVLHEDVGQLHLAAKASLRLNYERHKGAKKFAYVGRWLCNCSLEDLRREMKLELGVKLLDS